MTEKRGPGRPRTATPKRTKEGHSARVWVECEGEKVRTTVKLGTKSRIVARARSKRVLAGEAPELVAEKSESFESAARRWLEASAVKDRKRMLGRLSNHAFPVIGQIPVSELTSVHIFDVLEDVAGKVGGWTGSVRNVRDAISKVLGLLVARRVLDVNEALRIKLKGKDSLGGKRLRKVRPPRAVLTDGEFEPFLAWLVVETEHAHPGRARRALEDVTLYFSARVFGMRSSDAFSWRWEMIELGAFGDAYVPRQKTEGHLLDDEDEAEDEALVLERWRDEPRAAIPEGLAGWLRLWWEASGRPEEGFVWPVRQGARAGGKRTAGAHALRLRRRLWQAGVSRARPGVTEVKSPADCVLQTGIARRMSPVDFHSFRRAAATAAGKAAAAGQLSLREAMLLTHHSDPAVFARYQAREERIVVPESSVPAIVAAPEALSRVVKHSRQPKTAVSEGKEAEVRSGPPTSEGIDTPVFKPFSPTASTPVGVVQPHKTTDCHYSLPVFESLAEVLEFAVQLAMREGDMSSAKALLDVAERRRATLPDNVRPLAPSARKGGKP